MQPSQATSSGLAVEVRRCLGRILDSPEFRRSKRLCALLTFLVEQTLAGQSAELKESTVAMAVYERDASFDSATDNIVRVEIRRLRAKLDSYYERAGWLEPYRIEIPKGSYVPYFHQQSVAEGARGRHVEGYRIATTIAYTPDGALFQTVSVNTGREVLLWLSNPISDLEAALDRCRETSQVTHTRICTPQDFGIIGGRIYMVLAALPGEVLTERLRRGPMSSAESRTVLRHVASAVDALHAAGALHGSLRPECVILPDGKPDEANLMLFAAETATEADDHGRSPEQRRGEQATARSDIWALGRLLSICSPGQGGALADVAARCLQQNPQDRFESAADVAAALGGVESPAARPAPKPHRKARWWAAAGVLAVSLLGAAWAGRLWTGLAEGTTPQGIRVAVLPFTGLGGDPETVSVGRALSELVGAQLAANPSLSVIAQRTLSRLAPEDLEQIRAGKALDAAYAMDGTVLREGDRLTVVAKLFRTSDLAYVWTGTYSVSWNDVYALEGRVASDAAQALGVASPQRPSWTQGTNNPDAFALWSRGHVAALDFVNNLYLKSMEEPERLLRNAIDLDPAYADPMVDLGFMYWMAAFPPTADQSRKIAAAEEWFRKALERVPEHPFAKAFLGRILLFRGERETGLRMIRDAVKRDPNDPYVRFAMFGGYLGLGFWESAVVELDALSATDPLINLPFDHKAYALLHLNQYKAAAEVLDSLPANSPRRAVVLTLIHLRQGDLDQAEAVLEDLEARNTEPDLTNALLGALLDAQRGNRDGAEKAVRETTGGYRITNAELLLYAVLGREREFLKTLPLTPLHDNYRWLVTEPRLRPLFNSPDFQELLRERYAAWQADLAAFGSALPVAPPALPDPGTFLADALSE